MQKALFGAYLNTAQHNAYMIINEINEKLGGYAKVGEENLHEQKNSKHNSQAFEVLINGTIEEKTQTMRLLRQHFRFLNVFVGDDAHQITNQATIIYDLLISGLTRLNEERNSYSHYYKQHRNYEAFYSAKTVHDQQETLNKIKETFLAFLGEEGTEQRKIAQRLYYDLNTPIATENYKGFKGHFKSEHQILWDKTNPKAFSEKGLVFFICLFLTKKQGELFISNIVGLKDTRTPIERMVRSMYLHNCCQLPQPRLESSDILLDMLNELRKAPKELQKLIAINDQKTLQLIEEEKDEEGNILKINDFFRNSKDDRFPYFVLRYFDEVNAFPTMRFQLYLGKLVQQKYQAPIQGKSKERFLLKEVHTFGKLSDFSNPNIALPQSWVLKKPAYLENSENPIQEYHAGDIVHYSPHYQLSGNRIALRFTRPFLFDVQKPKEHFSIQNLPADAILSVYELQNLYLYHFLHKEGNITISAEYFIQNYIKTFRKFIHDVKTKNFKPIEKKETFSRKKVTKALLKRPLKSANFPYSAAEIADLKERKELLQKNLDDKYGKNTLKLSYLPDVIVEYLLQYEDLDYREEVLGKFRNIKQDTEDRLRLFEKHQELVSQNPQDLNLRKKKGFQQGNLADWLAADMIYLKPYEHENPKNLGKPNNDKANRLQKLLAQYGGYKEELPAYFEELGLTFGNAQHPFLKEVGTPNTLFEFYHNYLKARRRWHGFHTKDKVTTTTIQVKGVYEKMEGNFNPKTGKHWGFMDLELVKKDYAHLFPLSIAKPALEKNYLENIPISLPRGLFNEAIIKGFKEKKLDFENGKPFSAVDAINKFFKKDTQKFYDADRHYVFKRPETGESNGLTEEKMNELENKFLKLSSRKAIIKNEITTTIKAKNDFFSAELDKIFKKIHDYKEANPNANSKTDSKLKSWKAQIKKLEENLAGDAKRQTLLFIKNDILEIEKLLRFEQSKDRCLWLMANNLAKKRIDTKEIQISFTKLNSTEDYKLSELDAFLDSYIEMSVKVGEGKVGQVFEKTQDANGNPIVQILEREIIDDKTGKKTLQRIPKVKGEDDFVALSIKNYGNLRKFAKDRRLPDLFKYFTHKEFSKTQLEKGLDILENRSYEKTLNGQPLYVCDKIVVLEKAMELEKVIHKKWGEPEQDFENTKFGKYWKQEQPNDTYISHNTYIKFLQDNDNDLGFNIKNVLDIVETDINSDVALAKQIKKGQSLEATLIIMLRNKIIHNEVPYNTFLAQKIALQKIETPLQVMEEIIDIVVKIYEKLTNAVVRAI